MTNDRALLVEFCEWFSRKQSRNTRVWTTPEEKEHPECPNAADVAVFLSTVSGHQGFGGIGPGVWSGECDAAARSQADAAGLAVPGVNAPCPHGCPPGGCAECDGGSSPEMVCPECRDRPGHIALDGQEVPCKTCGRMLKRPGERKGG